MQLRSFSVELLDGYGSEDRRVVQDLLDDQKQRVRERDGRLEEDPGLGAAWGLPENPLRGEKHRAGLDAAPIGVVFFPVVFPALGEVIEVVVGVGVG